MSVETSLKHAQRVVEEPERGRIWHGRHARLVLDRIAETFGDGAIRNTAADTVTIPGVSAVDHPRHYNAHPSGVECITVVEHFNFNVGNAIKYLWRAGEKGDRLEDLKKSRWYVEREIQRIEGEAKKA